MKSILSILLFCIGLSLSAQQYILTTEKKQAIADYINHFEKNDQLMGAVAISENGNEVLNIRFGKYPKESTQKDHMMYTIGSITKMFTATLIAQLQEEGKLSFEDKLAEYYPNIPNADKINLKQMLNHTSGLQNYVVKQDSIYFWLKKPVTEKEILNEIIRQGTDFEPGDSMDYSNSAYYLLGQILEKELKQPFKQIVAKRIVKPLNLEHIYGIDAESNHTNIAKSYEKKAGEWQEMEDFYFPNVSAAGGIIATPSDLNVFIRALFSHKIIRESSLESMLPEKGEWFGMGIMQVPFYDHIAYGHGGDTYGTHSICSYNPKNGLAISYSIHGENYPTNDFALGLLSIIYDREYTLPEFKSYSPDLNYYDLYEGSYASEDLPIKIKVYREKDQLFAQGDGQNPFQLSPTEKHVFEYSKFGIKMEFDPAENTMILNQAGQQFKMKKQ
jgi:D-alanyl-D-alanine carboxypeptidase